MASRLVTARQKFGIQLIGQSDGSRFRPMILNSPIGKGIGRARNFEGEFRDKLRLESKLYDARLKARRVREELWDRKSFPLAMEPSNKCSSPMP